MPENVTGFVYIDINNPMAAWNVVRSGFYSPSCLPSVERAGALSFWFSDLLRDCNRQRAEAEFRLEHFRQQKFPEKVSRLTGIFTFDDVASALKVCDSDWKGHFSADCLTDVGISAYRSSRMDADWIRMMRSQSNHLLDGWEEMAEHYWSGLPASSKPTWEFIIEGYVTIWGLELKQRALQEIQRYWPSSLLLLEVAANSRAIGSHDGVVMPRASVSGEKIKIDYYLRIVDGRDPDFCARLGKFMQEDGPQVCRIAPARHYLVTPDFSEFGFSRNISGADLWLL
jgi:hypothetical protein